MATFLQDLLKICQILFRNRDGARFGRTIHRLLSEQYRASTLAKRYEKQMTIENLGGIEISLKRGDHRELLTANETMTIDTLLWSGAVGVVRFA